MVSSGHGTVVGFTFDNVYTRKVVLVSDDDDETWRNDLHSIEQICSAVLAVECLETWTA
jgi:hypothetical protein